MYISHPERNENLVSLFFRYFSLVLVLLSASCGGGRSAPDTSAFQVDAGQDQTTTSSDVLALDAMVTDDSESSQNQFTYSWLKQSGPGIVSFSNPVAEDPTATFSEPGSYVLILTVSTGDDSVSDTLNVTVNQKAEGISGLAGRPSNSSECIAPPTPPVVSNIQLENPYPNLPSLNSPLAMYMSPGDSTHWYVVQQSGQILRFENRALVNTVSTFVDIDDGRLATGGERGLLGMAFHPDYAANGYVYLSYTSGNAQLESRISRFSLDGTGAALDVTSEQILMTIPQPYNNHNGGQILFGSDSYLYIGMGDGGSGGDPDGNGQSLNTLLGAMLRIDVGDGSLGSYSIPVSNPFANGGGAPEIFAYGLRNPWRWSFDRETGELWAGDVGQNNYEEIDIIVNGANYGWNTMEGLHCYIAAGCDQTGLTLPVAEYDHTVGFSVTGGYVYRGTDIPFLQGLYLYADYSTGRIWSLEETGAAQYSSTELLDTSLFIASFAEDHDGELYILDLGGSIRKIAGDTGAQASIIPGSLSGWGCFQAGDVSTFSGNVIPYDINTVLWADNAGKSRFMAIPDNTTINIDSEGRFDFPEGSVVGKNFSLNGQLIETRLLLHHQQPYGWKGYSYEWNDSQTDATLLTGAQNKNIAGQTWHYPSRSECDICHTSVAGFTLGPEVGQVNRSLVYPETGVDANQLVTLESINVLANTLSDAEKSTTWYAIDDVGYSAERRARSYLHSNCANCHQPGGPGGGTMDLRMLTTLSGAGICNETPSGDNLGLINPVLVAPGDPDASILVLRMEDTGKHRMPPLASGVVDTQAMSVIRRWINELTECR